MRLPFVFRLFTQVQRLLRACGFFGCRRIIELVLATGWQQQHQLAIATNQQLQEAANKLQSLATYKKEPRAKSQAQNPKPKTQTDAQSSVAISTYL